MPIIASPMRTDETQRLLRRVLEERPDEAGALLERIRPRVVMWCGSHLTRSLRARIDPEDLAQRILFKVYERLIEFRGNGTRAFFQWVWQIGRNEIIDLHRFFSAERRAEDPALGGSDTFAASDRRRRPGQAAAVPTPSKQASRQELLDQVTLVLTTLPDDMQAAFRYCRLEGMSAQEASAHLGDRSANAVRVLVCKAMKRIRDGLQGMGVVFGEFSSF